jgi:hypothetical protein
VKRRPGSGRQIKFRMVPLACLSILATASCSSPHNSGGCDAQGSGNTVNCFQATSEPAGPIAAQSSVAQPGPISSPPPAPSQGFTRQWGPGTLLITTHPADLDTVPPNVNSTDQDILIGINSELHDDSNLAQWTSTGEPSAASCANLISTQGVQDIKLVKGNVICAATDQGNIAVLTIERVDLDSLGYPDDTLVEATIWVKQ